MTHQFETPVFYFFLGGDEGFAFGGLFPRFPPEGLPVFEGAFFGAGLVVFAIYVNYFFFVDLLGFKPGVLPGVLLLSLRRRSGLPVDGAIGFGPGLMA
ncbi:MAG: hypothetical protein HYZ14_03215 [Bacteroidetes bacterium]|nr:hypothetical protein [Bacteroidota bacterium]